MELNEIIGVELVGYRLLDLESGCLRCRARGLRRLLVSRKVQQRGRECVEGATAVLFGIEGNVARVSMKTVNHLLCVWP